MTIADTKEAYHSRYYGPWLKLACAFTVRKGRDLGLAYSYQYFMNLGKMDYPTITSSDGFTSVSTTEQVKFKAKQGIQSTLAVSSLWDCKACLSLAYQF